VADLLECLIQIKGVADTPRRLAARVGAALSAGRESDAAAVVARLAAAEARFASCLEAMLAEQDAAIPSLDLTSLDVDSERLIGESMQAFARRREQVVRALDRCSGQDLNRIGLEPSRGPMTVADLVALMLAHDTDQLGRLIADGGTKTS
jgi:hypothetical protein